MSEMEAEFLRRTGKRLGECTVEEIMAYADIGDGRRAESVSNDNGESAA